MNQEATLPWFRRFSQTWKRLSKKIGDFQARVFLTVFYFVIVGPFAVIVKWSSDPLALKPGSQRGWHSRSVAPVAPLPSAQRQF